MILALMGAALLLAPVGDTTKPQRARANLNEYFSSDDYPEAALRQRAEGTTAFSLDIDAAGAISRCTITRSAGDASLDAATCSILVGRVHYQPARDARGRAVAGSDEGRVTWRLPPLPPLRAQRTVSVMRADGAGNVTCAVTVNGVPQTDVSPERCGPMAGNGADRILRRVRTPTELTAIMATGPASAGIDTVDAGEAILGNLQFDVVTEFGIGPDGRVASCETIRRNVDEAVPARLAPDLCAARPVNSGPIFERSAGAAPRVARFRSAIYVKGGPLPYGDPTGRARANLSSYFSADDFPEAARMRRAEGTVAFRIGISPEGRVTDCIVTHSSGDTLLDETTCTILRERARYEPARDAAQRPMAGTDSGRVTWRLPPGYEPNSLAPMRTVTRMWRVSPDEVRCTVAQNGALLPGETHGACGDLADVGAEEWMRQPGGPSEITYVFAVGGVGTGIDTPAAEEAGYGHQLVEMDVSLSVARDGRIIDCRVLRNVQGAPSSTNFGGPCDIEMPDDGPFFLASTEAAPRLARMRTAVFIK